MQKMGLLEAARELDAFWRKTLGEVEYKKMRAGANSGVNYFWHPEYAQCIRALGEAVDRAASMVRETPVPQAMVDTTGLTVGQTKMGLRSQRYVKGLPWNSDVD